MNKKTFLLTLFSTLYTVNAQAATSSEAPGGSSLCTAMPSCESLGYAKSIASDCQDSLSCPFDTAYKICLDTKGKCAVGDIFYSDTSCTSAANYDSSKKAVGVVFMLTDCLGKPVDKATSNHGRVVNLHDLYAQSHYMFVAENPYSGSYAYFYGGLNGTTISDLTSYTTSSVTTSGSLGYALNNNIVDVYDGKSNTNKILAAVSSVSCSSSSGTVEYARYCRAPAVEAAYAFYPPNVSAKDYKVGAGQWYLPSMGELVYLYGIDKSAMTSSTSYAGSTGTTKTIVNNTLSVLASKLGSSYAATLTENSYYWSSTQDDDGCFWGHDMSLGSRGLFARTLYNHARVVLAF